MDRAGARGGDRTVRRRARHALARTPPGRRRRAPSPRTPPGAALADDPLDEEAVPAADAGPARARTPGRGAAHATSELRRALADELGTDPGARDAGAVRRGAARGGAAAAGRAPPPADRLRSRRARRRAVAALRGGVGGGLPAPRRLRAASGEPGHREEPACSRSWPTSPGARAASVLSGARSRASARCSRSRVVDALAGAAASLPADRLRRGGRGGRDPRPAGARAGPVHRRGPGAAGRRPPPSSGRRASRR